MDITTPVQTLDEPDCILLGTITLGKGMSITIIHLSMGK